MIYDPSFLAVSDDPTAAMPKDRALFTRQEFHGIESFWLRLQWAREVLYRGC
jgi:hypothetical protein